MARKPLSSRSWLPLVALALFAAGEARAISQTQFPANSLIIPTQANYQTSCGMVSAYGLVYNILRANYSLNSANGHLPTGCPTTGCHPITVHWVYSPVKNSPNRCVPMQSSVSGAKQDIPPRYSGASSDPLSTDPGWNDGCDFRIDASGTPGTVPVMLIDNAANDITKDQVLISYSTCSNSGTPSTSKGCQNYTGGTWPNPWASNVPSNYTAGVQTTDPKKSPTAPASYSVTVGGTTYTWAGMGGTTNIINSSWPQYPAWRVDAASQIDRVGYSGGVFVITASDAPLFRALLSGAISNVKDSNLSNVDFSPYVTTPWPSSAPNNNTNVWCNVKDNSGSGPATYFLDPSAGMVTDNNNDNAWYANEHHVNIHRAVVPFAAYDSQQLINTPPRIALLQTSGGIYSNNSNDCNSGVHGSNTGYGASCAVVSDMLPKYLKSAALDFSGAHGCLASSVNANDADLCPYKDSGGAVKSGLIYDSFDVLDFASSSDPLNHPASTSAAYRVVWVPHWNGTSTFVSGKSTYVPIILNSPPTAARFKNTVGACDNTCQINASKNIATYARTDHTNDPLGPVGLLAECASIALIEGNVHNNTFTQTAGTPGSSLLTCAATGANLTNGVCDSPASSATQGLYNDGSVTSGTRQSCTDPSTANGTNCIYFGPGSQGAGNVFGQIGDYVWTSRSGFIDEFQANPVSSVYRPGVQPLGFTIFGANTGQVDTYSHARAQMQGNTAKGFDNFTFIQTDNNPNEALVIYLGGHTYSGDVAGTRVVLNSIFGLGLQRSTGESAFVGATGYSYNMSNVNYDAALVATFDRITNVGAPAAWQTYSPTTGSQWYYPYHKGHLHAWDGNSITSGTVSTGFSGFPDAHGFSITDAAAVLNATDPGVRNMFTYLGGSATADPNLGVGKKAPNGSMQTGWSPVELHADALKSGCLDKLTLTQVCGKALDGTNLCTSASITPTKSLYRGTAYAGMVPGANGACDLEEALEVTVQQTDLTSDLGVLEQSTLVSKLTASSAIRDAQEMLMVMRGYCYSTSTKLDGNGNAPSSWPGVCNNPSATNTPQLGALVRSQPVVVGPSVLIADAPIGKKRPTVAYVGGWDGMLHAFYLPSSADGSDVGGYTGPAVASAPVNSSASSLFRTSYTTFPSNVTPLTELWAFMPPGQLPYVKSNSARVDSTPAVIDVFGDFNGTGLRSWHTVLVSSAGGTNREIFALDVTNPVAPTLLWDINSTADTSLPYAPMVLSDDDTQTTQNTDAQSFLWNNACHLNTSSTCTPASFLLPPATDPGRITSTPFNYLHLGASLSLDVGLLRRHNIPVYAAFIATNEANGQGVYVFAIDLVTGQKIWEFANPYAPPFSATSWASSDANRNAGIGNSAPPGVTLASLGKSGFVDTVYVGDDMGRLWEIDAADGINRTAYTSFGACTPAGGCNYALSDAYASGSNNAQPISTKATLFYLPSPLTGNFSTHAGELMLTYGTAGTDTVASLDTNGNISGSVHLLSLAPQNRLYPPLSTTQVTNAQTNGVGTEIGPFPLTGGNRLYGNIQALGSELVYSTTLGGANSAESNLDKRGTLDGGTYDLRLDNTAVTAGSSTGQEVIAAGAGASGGTPLIILTLASGKKVIDTGNMSLPANDSVVSAKVISVTDQTVLANTLNFTATVGATINATANQLTAVTGNAGGLDGTLRVYGWFYRSLGREY